MDYIYGSLNEDVEQVEYYGVNTDTANTTIEQEDRTIKVDVKKVPNTLTITSGNSEVVYDGSSAQTINIDSGSDYSAGEGITISDNTISIDSETVATKEDVASVRTYKTFNNGWNVSGTTQEFCQSIEADDTALEGTAYLGTLHCSDLPNTVQQAEATVEIISNGANGKCIDITLTSLEVAPYRWTYSYGRVNGGVVTVGWKGSQEELVSGTNIKTINGGSILGSGDLTISAGTTLTQYSGDSALSNSTMISLMCKRINKAKGHINGTITITVDGSARVFNIDTIIPYSNNGAYIYGFTMDTSSPYTAYIITGQIISGNLETSRCRFKKITTDGITDGTWSSMTQCNFKYWNDTEITA